MKSGILSIVVLFLFFQSCRKDVSRPQHKVPTSTSDKDITSYSYYPANTWGTLAYEDNWSMLGDYDMNDLVVSYKFAIGKNNKGQVVSIKADFAINAVGASYINGFGIQFPFAASKVSSVTGQQLTMSYITLNKNGTENGSEKAVIFPFDNTENLLHYPDYSYFVNVYNDKAKAISDTAHIVVTLTAPLDTSLIGAAPFDPFLVSNLRRNREIHLAGHQPTSKADMTMFNQGDDNSKGGKNYQTAGKLPWALNFPKGNFAYPAEGKSLTDTYLRFADWEASSGLRFSNWQTNTTVFYRNSNNLYHQ